jgi:hypothetical protein
VNHIYRLINAIDYLGRLWKVEVEKNAALKLNLKKDHTRISVFMQVVRHYPFQYISHFHIGCCKRRAPYLIRMIA